MVTSSWSRRLGHVVCRLHDVHGQVLLDLDVGLLREFFRAFFADPSETMWRKFLAWDMTRCGPKEPSVRDVRDV